MQHATVTELIHPNALLPDIAAELIASQLNAGPFGRGAGPASLALSGGRSPIPLLQQLSQKSIAWEQLDLLLVDERWQAPPEDRNQGLVASFIETLPCPPQRVLTLLQDESFENNLAQCNTLAADCASALDVVVLGMGLDGHTASLFPCASEYPQALSSTARYVGVTPTTAPYQRISMSLHWLLQARCILFYLPGAAKLKRWRELLDAAIDDSAAVPTGTPATPIQALVAAIPERIILISSEDAP